MEGGIKLLEAGDCAQVLVLGADAGAVQGRTWWELGGGSGPSGSVSPGGETARTPRSALSRASQRRGRRQRQWESDAREAQRVEVGGTHSTVAASFLSL